MTNIPDKLGKYHVKGILGQGAMGIVYQGFDPDIKRRVAIKVLHSHLCQGDNGHELVQRFHREAQAAARCPHPNIVMVFDLGKHLHQDYIVMEYIEGEELTQFMKGVDKVSTEEAIFIIISVLKALSAAHQQNIVHRDIKPANIILLNNGEVKVADFGVAQLDKSDLTMIGHMVGTPNYMSPEGLRGEEVDNQADIYSAGMVLLEMLTGARLSPEQLYSLSITEFINDVFAQCTPLLSESIKTIIHKSLAKDKKDRFGTAQEFIKEIEQLTSIEEQVVATTVAKSTLSVKSQRSIKLSKKTLIKLEKELASHIGPLAHMLVRKSTTVNISAEKLMYALSDHIGDRVSRDHFISQAKKTISGDQQYNQAPLATKNNREDKNLLSVISQHEIDQTINILAYYLGPVAKHQTLKYLKLDKNQPNLLCENLVNLIKKQSDKDEFKRKFSLVFSRLF